MRTQNNPSIFNSLVFCCLTFCAIQPAYSGSFYYQEMKSIHSFKVSSNYPVRLSLAGNDRIIKKDGNHQFTLQIVDSENNPTPATKSYEVTIKVVFQKEVKDNFAVKIDSGQTSTTFSLPVKETGLHSITAFMRNRELIEATFNIMVTKPESQNNEPEIDPGSPFRLISFRQNEEVLITVEDKKFSNGKDPAVILFALANLDIDLGTVSIRVKSITAPLDTIIKLTSEEPMAELMVYNDSGEDRNILINIYPLGNVSIAQNVIKLKFIAEVKTLQLDFSPDTVMELFQTGNLRITALGKDRKMVPTPNRMAINIQMIDGTGRNGTFLPQTILLDSGSNKTEAKFVPLFFGDAKVHFLSSAIVPHDFNIKITWFGPNLLILLIGGLFGGFLIFLRKREAKRIIIGFFAGPFAYWGITAGLIQNVPDGAIPHINSAIGLFFISMVGGILGFYIILSASIVPSWAFEKLSGLFEGFSSGKKESNNESSPNDQQESEETDEQ